MTIDKWIACRAFLACSLSWISTAWGGTQTVPGLYALRICEGACAAAGDRAFITGRVVLFAKALHDKEGHVMIGAMQRNPNGCFFLTRVREHKHSLVGGNKADALKWKRLPGGDGIAFSLFPSPDAGYGVELHPSPHGFSGTGATWMSLRGVGRRGLALREVVELRRLGGAPKEACDGIPLTRWN